MSLVFMDACRNDPQLEAATRQLESKSLDFGSRLCPGAHCAGSRTGAGVAAANDGRPAGMLIAYAAAPGSIALDGQDKVSPFTKALLKHIQKAGTPITEIMGLVGQDVWHETDRQQRPWYVSELSAPFVLQRLSRPVILP